MSHIATVYAKDLGARVGKATIQDHFFPTTKDKYIACATKDSVECHQYDYWNVVFNLIGPILSKEKIGFIELEDNNNEYGSVTTKQKNNIIKNSMAYVGINNHYAQTACIYDKPCVSLLANTYPSVTRPSKDAHVLHPDFSETKPSFSSSESPKRINEIKAEVVAQKILNVLNIDEKIDFKTKFIGSGFLAKNLEIYPDFFGVSEQLKNSHIVIRGDLHFDLNNIIQWSHFTQNAIVIKDAFPEGSVFDLSRNTKKIILYVDDIKDDLDRFLKELKQTKIEFDIVTKKEESLQDLRLKYFDFKVFLENQRDISNIVNENTKFISNKTFFAGGQTYNSYLSYKKLDNSNSFVLNEYSQKELESYYLYE